MLVITKIRDRFGIVYGYTMYKGIEDSREHLELDSKYNDYSVTMDIYDSVSKKMYNNLNLAELYDLVNGDFKKLYGVVDYDCKHIFIAVDFITWKLLDYITEVREYKVTISIIDSFLYSIFPDLKIKSNDKCKYYTNKGTIYVSKYGVSMEKLDDLGVFWKVGAGGFTHRSLSFIYSLVDLDELLSCDILILIDTDNSNAYKLEVNNNVKRVLTKSKVIKECW